MSGYARVAVAVSAIAASGLCAGVPGAVDLNGKPANPFAIPAQVRVLLFVRTDCPITNRYAPELQRLAAEFKGRDVRFWLIYPDKTETPEGIRDHIAQYHFPGAPLRDPEHRLVRRAQATVAPEAAVFDAQAKLIYHGRIDDRYVDVGKARAAPRTHDLEDAIAAMLAGKPVTQPAGTRAVGCSLADIE